MSARVLAIAGFHDLSHGWKQAKPKVFAAAVLSAVGITGFVVSTAQAEDKSAAGDPQLPARVTLIPDGRAHLSKLLGHHCPSFFEVVVMKGGVSGPWQFLVTDKHCVHGLVDVTSEEAKVLVPFPS